MKLFDIFKKKNNKNQEAKPLSREAFWDKLREEEPGHPGCKLYDT
jgi:hypothetical protein